MGGAFWGRMFPKAFWSRWFQGGPADTGLPPAGVAAFVLEENATVTYAWATGLFKSYSGLERRSNLLDDPAQRYEGSALLVGKDTRATRAKLARFAAQGQAFSVGLAYESMPITADSTGTVVTVTSTAGLDWAVYGGRVLVRRRGSDGKYTSIATVITAVTGTTITVANALGSVGQIGAEIMPTMASYLDAQQGFARYAPSEPVERWGLKARCAIAGFASAAQTATLPLASPLTTGVLVGLTIRARTAGAAGNSISITQTDDAPVAQGLRSENLVTGAILIKYKAGETTVDQYIALVNGSALVYVDGTFTTGAVLASTVNTFSASLTGGADSTPAEVGRGATVTEFLSRPVWDRGIDIEGTVGDSMQAMTVTQDLGGLPFTSPTATVPDWGRQVQYARGGGKGRPEWQWLKRFLWEVAGRWRSWWLASWRADLLPVSVGVGTLTVDGTEDGGDFHAWYPSQQKYLQVVVAGVAQYVQISGATDNVDGTITIQIADEDGVAVTLSGVPELVSWLERVRWESDEGVVRFAGAGFAFSAQARVVQQPTQGTLADFDDYEASVEDSQPREAVKISYAQLVDRIALGTRDGTFNGETYTASPALRDGVAIVLITENAETVLRLPVSHPVIERYLQGGVPPRQIVVDIWRRHSSGAEETVWRGIVSSIAVDNTTSVASLRLVSRALHLIDRRLPTLNVGRACQHILYGANTCRVDRSLFAVAATVASFDGRIVTLSTIGGQPDQWARGGELLHVASGERMTVESQTGTSATCQLQIQGMAIGDSVVLYAGCDHNVAACRDKFANMVNFGGFPQMSTERPFQPGKGFGIIVQP